MTKRFFCSKFGRLALAAFALVLFAQPLMAQNAYERALERFESDDLEGSLLILKQAMKEDPNWLSSHILLARIYLRIGEGAAAQDALRKAQGLGGDPNILEPLVAESLLQQRKFKELTVRDIPKYLSPEVRSDLALARGKAQIALGAHEIGRASLEQAIQFAPRAVAPRVTLVTFALHDGDVSGADEQAAALLSLAPGDADAWYVSGSVKHTMGNLYQAVNAYDSALELDDLHYGARISRAGALVDLVELAETSDEIAYLRQEAGKDFAYLRIRYPADPRAAYLESVHHTKLGNKREAREALQRTAAVTEQIPSERLREDPKVELLAGIANYELEAFERAQYHLNRYIERYPNQAGPRRILGAILVRQGRAEEAIQTLEPTLHGAPSDIRVLALLGTAYMQAGRPDLGARHLEQAAGLSGGSAELRTRLAISRIAQGLHEQGDRELAAVFEDDPKRNTDAGLALAVAYLKTNRPAKAHEVANKLAEVSPDDLTVLNLLASAQLASGLSDAAESTYRKALQIDPEFLPASLNLAKLEASRGQFDAARARLKRVLNQRPESVRTMIGLARVEEQAGRVASAQRWIHKARDADPDNIPALVGAIDLYLRIGDTAKVLEVTRDARSRAPENLRVLAAVARAHVALERPDLAQAVYQRMAMLAEFDVDELYKVARSQLAIGAGADADYSLTKVLRSQPSHLSAKLLRIEAALLNDEPQVALEMAQRFRNEHPALAVSHRLIGDALSRLSRPTEAAISYRRALELEPTTDHLLALYRKQRLADPGGQGGGRSLLIDWLQKHPSDSMTRLALAEDFLAAGELTEARSHYETVLAVAPEAPAALNNLAYILDKLGESGAIDLARRAYQVAPNDPAVADTLGWLLVRRGQPVQGLKYLREAQSRASGSREIRYHIGAALAALDRTEEARRELRQATAPGTAFESVEEARALLKKLGG